MIDSLISSDVLLFQWINGSHHPAFDCLFLIITQFGNGWLVAPILIGSIMWKIPRQQWVASLLCGVISMTACGLINTSIKQYVNRARPAAFFQSAVPPVTNDAGVARMPGKGIPFKMHLVGTGYLSHSFPSGHTNTAFSAATFCAFLLGGYFYWGYAIAVLVGYSRIYLGAHFPLDVVAGALTGTILMLLFLHIGRSIRIPGKITGNTCFKGERDGVTDMVTSRIFHQERSV